MANGASGFAKSGVTNRIRRHILNGVVRIALFPSVNFTSQAMDNYVRLPNVGILLVVIVVSVEARQAEAQIDRVDFFQTWQRRSSKEVLSELRDTQGDMRRSYKDYVRAVRDVQKERAELVRDNPGQIPHNISLRCAWSAWRSYQDEVTKAQLLLLILRRRRAGLPAVNFQPRRNFNQFAGARQPRFPFPAMNRQWKAFGKTPLAGLMYLSFFDTNRDGKISRREAVGTPLAGRFTKLDSNRDGFLAPSEMTP